MAYTRVNWVNGGPPYRNATNLNVMDAGIANVDTRVTALESGGGSGADARVSGLAVYAKDFGAVGNDSTNDTTALQNALNAVPLDGTLHLEKGKNYRITAALTWPTNVSIDGHGAHIHQATANANALTSTDGVNLSLRDLTVRGPVEGVPSGTGKGIVCQRSAAPNVFRVSMERVIVHSFGSDGIELSNAITSHFSTVECRSNNGHGWNIHGVNGGAAGTSCVLTGCYGNGNAKAGFHVDTMTYMSYNGCAADSNGIGYELVSCEGNSFSGCGAESQENHNAAATGYLGHSWKFSGCNGITMQGCWTYDQPAIALLVTGNSQAVVATGFTENTPRAGATACVQIDAGSTATLIHTANTSPLVLTGDTVLLNDGGGLSLPGYIFSGDSAFIQGQISTGSPLKLLTTTTAGRPTAASAGQGACIYDTTLGKPIWSTGTAWRDAAGTTV
jgi:hypothetical protein